MFFKSFEQKITFQKILPYKIDFLPSINLIVGNNGTGKSTMLHLLNNRKILDDQKDTELILHNPKEHVNTQFFDSEKDNPRIKNTGNESMYDLVARFASHGETTMPIIKYVAKMKQCLIMLDEPEAGISLHNQLKLVTIFTKAQKSNQLIIATHSYPIIKSQEYVFNMDTKQWVTSQEYLKGL